MTDIDIIEVSPRDGLQNEKTVVETDDKVQLIERLIAAGARRIEAVSFVHPRVVPTMADAESVMARVPRTDGVVYSGLALNERGTRRAIEARVDEINFVLPVSDEFAHANQNSSVAGLLGELERSGALTRAAGIPLSVTLAVAFGCPYRGDIDADQVEQVARDALAAAEICELALADTIGCGTPGQVTELFSRAAALTSAPLRAHFHETRHTAIANSFAALNAGVRRLDSSVGGLGGCPFAPGAAGNVATEDLVWALHREGHRTSIDPTAAAEAGSWISQVVGVQPRSGVASAGVFPAVAMPEVCQPSARSKRST
jgi:hydroxymethylglutaryl-CoA lyase